MKMKYNTDVLVCIADIDECLTANLCSDICVNTDGGYGCSCNNGSRLEENQISCQGMS